MNFQDLMRIEDTSFYIDQAFKKSKLKGHIVFLRASNDQLNRIKNAELEKLKVFGKTLYDYMDNILKKFPSIDGMPEFYNELVRTTLDYDMLKKSLGALNWSKSSFKDFMRKYEVRLKSCSDKTKINQIMNEYYGRMISVLKQIQKNLKYLEQSRVMMKTYPSVKTDLYTVAITGFPNIGKSTLLSRITPAKPEIKNYAFTTKNLNQGYAMFGVRKLQFVDTPGVLNRERMNPIEQQAYLVLKYLANVIVYVIDLTEPYSIKDQEKLLKGLKEYDKPIIIYLSKADIIDKSKIDKARKKYKAISSIEELELKLEKQLKEHYFDR